MLRLSAERDTLTIVHDQIGNPTSALDLAVALIKIVPKLAVTNSGIYHFVNKGETSWYDFAKAIFEIKNKTCTLSPITTSQYPTAAQRPLYSVLDAQKIEEKFQIAIRHWRTALQEMLLTKY